MKDIGIIQCSKSQAIPLIVGYDTVYVHTDIVKVDVDFMGNKVDNLYQCHEIQYDKDEYIRLMSEKNDELDEIINTLLGVEA